MVEAARDGSVSPPPDVDHIRRNRALRKAARINSKNKSEEGGGGDAGEQPTRLGGPGAGGRRGGPGGGRINRFGSRPKRKLKRQKTKWEESVGIIDELLRPGSKTYEAMTSRQRDRLWDVKKSLLNVGGKPSGELRTQHVPRELISAMPVVDDNDDEDDDDDKGDKDKDDEDDDKLGKPSALPCRRRTSDIGRQRNSDFILQEYAGVNRRSLLKDLSDIMENSSQKQLIIPEEESEEEDEEEDEEKEDEKEKEGAEIMNDESYNINMIPTLSGGYGSGPDVLKKFVPQEFSAMSELQQKGLFELLKWESITSWDFDVFKLDEITNGHPLLFVGWAVISAPYAQKAMAKKLGISAGSNYDANGLRGYTFMEELSIPPAKLCNYLRAIEADYNKANPYHNAIHASDVVQTMHTLIQNSKEESIFKGVPPLDYFAILLAAVVHDVEHPGKTNGFHVKIRSELALVHNDASVLENHHVAHAFATMLAKDLSASATKVNADDDSIRNRRNSREEEQSSQYNLLCNTTGEEFEKIRKLMIEAILHTDMTKHFEGVNAARGVLMEVDDDTKLHEHSWRILMYMLHLADISSQSKGSHLFEKWTDRCLEEFFLQGDVEAELGLPISALCDRNSTSKPESQVGFIQFVVEPAFGVLGEYSSFVKETVLPQIHSNLDHWSSQLEEQE